MRRLALVVQLLCAGSWIGYAAADDATRAAPVVASASADKSGAPKPEATPPLGLEAKESLSSVELTSGDYRVRLGTVIQADGRFFVDDQEQLGVDSFFLRRAEVTLRGSVRNYVDFNVTPNFGMGKATLSDVYVDFRLSSAARLRIGRTKVPVSLEFLQPNRMIMLLELSLPTTLAPGRDQGVMVHGAPWKGRLLYALGVFNGGVDGSSVDTDTDDGKEAVARILAKPFGLSKSNPLSGLSLGMAASLQEQEGALSSYKSAGQLPFFTYAKSVVADGRHARIAPQASFYSGPLGVQAEYVRSSQEVAKDVVRARLSHQAWSVIASVVLKGGTAGFDNVKIAHPFEPGTGHWGALQVVARIEGFDADGKAFTRGLSDSGQSAHRAQGTGLGLHWYLSQSLRCSVAYSRTRFWGGALAGNRPIENAVQFRSQVVF